MAPDRPGGQDACGRIRNGHEHQVAGEQAVRALSHYIHPAEAKVSLEFVAALGETVICEGLLGRCCSTVVAVTVVR